MTLFLWIGCACGGTLGLLHARHLYRQIAERNSTAGANSINRRGLYYGIWTFVLWTIFGSYVLAFWLIGAIATALIGLKPRKSSA
jgi:hypothetical protein